jgi:hypothetical protein
MLWLQAGEGHLKPSTSKNSLSKGGKKMKELKIFWACAVGLIFLMSCLLVHPTVADPGDVDHDGDVDIYDPMYLINYLFVGGPAPVEPIDADVDGSPGINLGDLLQLNGYLFFGCNLIEYTGVSVEVGSQIRISSTLIPPDTVLGTTATIPVKIIENQGPYLTGMVIPLSFASDPGQVEVALDYVDFSGGIVPLDWYTGSKIDNVNKKVVFYAYADPLGVTPIDSGTVGIIAQLHFTRTSVDSLPLVMSTTQVPPSHSFILIRDYCANGIPPSERIFTPKLSLARKGDCNGDGEVDTGDVMYLINYLFLGTSPPIGL